MGFFVVVVVVVVLIETAAGSDAKSLALTAFCHKRKKKSGVFQFHKDGD